MDTKTKNIIAVVVAIFLIGSAIYFTNNRNIRLTANNEKTKTENSEEKTEEKNFEEIIDWEKGIAFGNPEAPLKMVNYSVYSCPYCTRLHNETLPKIKDEYIDEGKLFYVFKGAGDPSSAVYQAAYCADEQLDSDELWTFQEIIFSDINRGANSEDILTAAKNGGITIEKEEFNNCLEQGKYKEQIQKIGSETSQLEIPGTPYVVIGGEEFVGYRPYEDVKQIIEEKLNEKNN